MLFIYYLDIALYLAIKDHLLCKGPRVVSRGDGPNWLLFTERYDQARNQDFFSVEDRILGGLERRKWGLEVDPEQDP
jgi:hypothetical protein